ncbi:MAG: septum formation initiator family protein [Pseudorhodoplanes sp.]|nr:septum formation initiator family protein [Pseudorhodoplanes sp.]
MVTRKRLRSVLTALVLYTMAALLVGYFGVNAFTGNRGLKAKHAIDAQFTELTADLERLKAERESWQRRVALLRSDRLDPDMLDEHARLLLGYAHPDEVTMLPGKP